MQNKPHKDKAGRFIHLCMALGCSAWGAYGFYFGELWLCEHHRGDHEKMQAEFLAEKSREILPAQGRLI